MADWEKALADHKVYAGSFDPAFWRTYLRQHPEVLHHILSDLHQVAGKDQSGPPSLDDLWELVAPKFSDKPFPEAFFDALGSRSIRQVAQRVSLNHGQVVRLVNGDRPIVKVNDPIDSMRRLELFAKALNVHPAYFAEWRRLWIMSLIDTVLATRPTLSIGIYRRFSGPEVRNQSEHSEVAS